MDGAIFYLPPPRTESASAVLRPPIATACSGCSRRCCGPPAPHSADRFRAARSLQDMASFESYRGVAYPWYCDSMSHMNTQFYSVLFDGATLHALARLAPGGELASCGLGWADVRQAIDYRREVRAGTLLVVRRAFLRCGRTSVSYRHELTDLETGQLHATSDQVTVLFDLADRKAAPLTEAMRHRVGTAGAGRTDPGISSRDSPAASAFPGSGPAGTGARR